jgi:2-C-methyl-D-erythritol 4-phosphate cytidylyltransferase
VELNPEDLIDDVAVVIVAGGAGERLGASRPKAFVGLAGKVLLAHSLMSFEEHEAVDSIVLVVPDGWVGPTEMLVDDLGCDRVTSIEVGGSSRAASVLAGLAGVPDRRATAVLVHDAARPLVSQALIDRVLSPLADGADAVVPSLPVADTVKRIDPDTGQVLQTLVRDELRLAQTPQACRASALHAALRDLDEAKLALVTDDAAAVEQAGGRVVCVPGEVGAHKVTTSADLQRLERQLAPAVVEEAPDPDEPDHPDDLEPLDAEDLTGFEGPGFQGLGDEA